MTWARIEDNHLVSFINTDPEGQYHEAIKWIKVPELYEDLEYEDLVLTKDGIIEPSSEESFNNFLFKKLNANRRYYLQTKTIEYKNTEFSIEKDLEALTSKMNAGNAYETNHKKGSYVVNFKCMNSVVKLNLVDLTKLVVLMDEVVNDAFDKQAGIEKSITETKDYQEKVNKSLYVV